MKTKWIGLVTALAFTTSPFAQETITGDAALEAAKPAKENNWQNWAFAGAAIIIAVVGITVVSLNEGHAKPAP